MPGDAAWLRLKLFVKGSTKTIEIVFVVVKVGRNPESAMAGGGVDFTRLETLA
ncbi:MAG: hypothetical protein ABSB67_20995 [Bryobacteraceae bacterium]|jgi:hypothetical protein